MKISHYTLLLILFYALYYLLPIEFRALWQPDELRYAEISREMLHSRNWVVPHFLELRYFEKPIAGYWINSLSQLIFGGNNFAVRFGAVFSTTLSALMVYWLALRLWQQRRTALISAVIFLTCFLVYGVGTYAVLDPMITLWLVAAMCSFWLVAEEGSATRQKLWGWVLLGLACGMGFMTKGFLALAVPAVAIVPWMLWQRRLRELLLYGPLAMICAALISAPWAIAIARQEGDFWHYFFWVEHIQRFASSDAQHKAPFWYYLPVLLLGSLPWLGLFPGALRAAWQRRASSPAGMYLLCWVVMPLLFFSLAKGKLLTYILPCFAPLALLMAYSAQYLVSGSRRPFKVNALINIVFGGLACLALLLVLAPWGPMRHPLFTAGEGHKALLGAAAFAVWGLFGILALCRGAKWWLLSALCPLGLALAIAWTIPDKVINSKQPQEFIQAANPLLNQSKVILSNHPGLASALAWELKRSDILLYDQGGELDYGLSYADGRDHLIKADDFPLWLAAQRRSGSVALVLKLGSHDDGPDASLPQPDRHFQRGRMLVWYYAQRP